MRRSGAILARVRTALADLVAELVALTPRDQEVPDKQAADQVVQFVITGDRSVINYSPQHAAVGGTIVAFAIIVTAIAGVAAIALAAGWKP
jgi:hypothetical protein